MELGDLDATAVATLTPFEDKRLRLQVLCAVVLVMEPPASYATFGVLGAALNASISAPSMSPWLQ